MATIVHVRSIDRQFGYPNEFRVNLPQPIKCSSITVIGADLATSWYAVPSGSVNINFSNCAISAGNYTTGTMAVALVNAAQTTVPTANVSSCSYNPVYNRFNLFASTAIQSNPVGTLHNVVGLSTTSVITANTYASGGYVLAFPGAPNLNPLRTAVVSLRGLSPGFLITNGAAGHFRFQMSQGVNSIGFYNASTAVLDKIAFGNSTIQYLDVMLTDDSGALLDTRGCEWSMTLAFVP